MLAAFQELCRLGGLESSRRANEQAAEMDSSGRLLGVHLRFLGIGSNDRRELSEQEVDEMLAAFQELCREWGRLGLPPLNTLFSLPPSTPIFFFCGRPRHRESCGLGVEEADVFEE